MQTPPRHRLFEAARARAQMGLEELWLDYLGLGGDAGLLELEAHLQGLMPLSQSQQDVLAHALNERLDHLHRANRLPYWGRAPDRPTGEDPLQVISQLLAAYTDGGGEHSSTTQRGD